MRRSRKVKILATLGPASNEKAMIRKLFDAGVVTELPDAKDERRRLLALSDAGQALLRSMAPLWDDVRAAVDTVFEQGTPQLMASLDRAEARLQSQGFGETIAACRRQPNSWLGATPCMRATRDTLLPGRKVLGFSSQ